MAAKLKVFRTPIGFHDAYVAAPSRKAALAAWGSDADLFARGQAEQVTDPALAAEPLAHPGEVIRRSRGSLEEQLAALPKAKAKPARKAAIEVGRATKAPPPRPKPRPDRSALDAAEAALAAAEARRRDAEADLRRREAALATERKAMEGRAAAEREKLHAAMDSAKAHYDAAMEAWRRT